MSDVVADSFRVQQKDVESSPNLYWGDYDVADMFEATHDLGLFTIQSAAQKTTSSPISQDAILVQAPRTDNVIRAQGSRTVVESRSNTFSVNSSTAAWSADVVASAFLESTQVMSASGLFWIDPATSLGNVFIPSLESKEDSITDALNRYMLNAGVLKFGHTPALVQLPNIPTVRLPYLLAQQEPSIPDTLGAIASVVPLGRELSARLIDLKVQQNEDPECGKMSGESLRTFFAFLTSTKHLLRPALSLTPDGEVYASWRAPGGRVFSVRFAANGIARYVIFRPGPKTGTMIRTTGSAPADVVLSISETASVTWAFE